MLEPLATSGALCSSGLTLSISRAVALARIARGGSAARLHDEHLPGPRSLHFYTFRGEKR